MTVEGKHAIDPDMSGPDPKLARQHWNEDFAEAIEEHGTDPEPLLPDGMSEEWDEAEWTW